MTGIEKQRQVYLKWWLGKMCRVNTLHEFKRVIDVKCYGAPSFFCGVAELVFEDNSIKTISMPSHAYKPRKTDVEVKEYFKK